MFGLDVRSGTAGLDDVRKVSGGSYQRAAKRIGFGGLSHLGITSRWVSSLLLHTLPCRRRYAGQLSQSRTYAAATALMAGPE